MAEKLRGRIQRRHMDAGFIEGVGAFIYCITTKRYLFLLRNTKKYAGTWGLAGGSVETNEYILTSLYRELEEELGYTFTDEKVIPIEKFTSDNGKFSYHTCVIPIKEEFAPVLNHEHRGFCWVPLEDHPKPLHPGVYRTLKFQSVVDKIKTLEQVL